MIARHHFGPAGLVLLLCLGLAGWLRGGAQAEDELKSATLLAFVENAHWGEPRGANAALSVGVLGRPAFVRCLHAAIDGKAVEGRPLRVVEVRLPVDPRCCQVLYFATDKATEIRPVLQVFSSEAVLTVGETDRFLDEGGAVNFFLVDGHMGFEVSVGTLDRSGITISSRLLRFGQIRDLAKGRTRR